jgi:hypothetical protein
MRNDFFIPAGSTSVLVTVPGWQVFEQLTECGFSGQWQEGILFSDIDEAYYTLNGKAPVAVTPATMTADTWATGGFIEHATTLEIYQIAVPDECFPANPTDIFFSDYFINFTDANNVANIHLHFNLLNTMTSHMRIR